MATTGKLRYEYWDILRAPRLALSGKALTAQARPLAYGLLGYFLLTYLALTLEEMSFAESFSKFSFLPVLALGLTHWYTYALWIFGIAAVIAMYDFGCLTAAKLAFEELSGNLFMPLSAAQKDARSNLQSLWVSGGLVLLLIVLLAVLQGVVSWVALIPGVGEIIYSALYGMLFFLWSLFIVFLGFGLTTAVFTLPAIIVAREKEFFGATFYIYNIIWSQPLRWFSLTAIGVILAKLGVWVLGYFFMRALQLTNLIASWFGGEKVDRLLMAGYNLLEPLRPLFDFCTSLYPGSAIKYDWIHYGGAYQATGSENIGAIIIAIAVFVTWIVIVSYGFNVITCSQLIAFLLIQYHEDKTKLTEGSAMREPEPNEIRPEKPNLGPPQPSYE